MVWYEENCYSLKYIYKDLHIKFTRQFPNPKLQSVIKRAIRVHIPINTNPSDFGSIRTYSIYGIGTKYQEIYNYIKSWSKLRVQNNFNLDDKKQDYQTNNNAFYRNIINDYIK